MKRAPVAWSKATAKDKAKDDDKAKGADKAEGCLPLRTLSGGLRVGDPRASENAHPPGWEA